MDYLYTFIFIGPHKIDIPCKESLQHQHNKLLALNLTYDEFKQSAICFVDLWNKDHKSKVSAKLPNTDDLYVMIFNRKGSLDVQQEDGLDCLIKLIRSNVNFMALFGTNAQVVYV